MMESKESKTYAKWLQKLVDRRAKIHILVRVERMLYGNPGDVQPVGEGISELRIHTGPGYRVYYKTIDGAVALLLVGGDKSSQSDDIKKAKKIAADYGKEGNDEW